MVISLEMYLKGGMTISKFIIIVICFFEFFKHFPFFSTERG